MSKKSQRRRKYKKSLKPVHSVAREAVKPLEPVSILPKPTVLPKVSVGKLDVGARYQYLKVELKHIGVIAGAMFLLLIILSFFL